VIQPIRPHEASGIYQRQVEQSGEPGANGTRRAGADTTHPGARHDQVSVSSEARQLRVVMQAMPSVPGERADVVAQLRQQITDGSYDVDATSIARRLVDDGLAL